MLSLEITTQNEYTLNLYQALEEIDTYKTERSKISKEVYYGFISTLFGGLKKTFKLEAANTLKEVLTGTLTVDFLQPYQKAYQQGELGKLYQVPGIKP